MPLPLITDRAMNGIYETTDQIPEAVWEYTDSWFDEDEETTPTKEDEQ